MWHYYSKTDELVNLDLFVSNLTPISPRDAAMAIISHVNGRSQRAAMNALAVTIYIIILIDLMDSYWIFV